MRVLAGIDVGNSTTEVVLADPDTDPPRPLAADRAPTRGRKGSVASAQAAALLVRRLQRRHGLTVTQALITPQRPVDTRTTTLPDAPPDTGRLAVLAAGSATPGAVGLGTGRPVPVGAEPVVDAGPVVLLVPAAVGYREAVGRIAHWLDAGAPVAGVLLAADEGVLVAHRLAGRLPAGVPVVDGADVPAAQGCTLVTVESGELPLRELVDALRLVSGFALADAERGHAEAVARALADVGNAAVGVRGAGRGAMGPGPGAGGTDPGAGLGGDPAVGGGVWFGPGAWSPFGAALPRLRRTAPGAASGYALPGGDRMHPVDDLWLLDLEAVTSGVEARRGSVGRATVLAALAREHPSGLDAVRGAVRSGLDVEVQVIGSEPAAARAGALTTPGARPGALVVDLGAGTIDVVDASGRELVAAGAGELVTAATSAVLGVPRGAADWVKREPSARLESPHVLVGEDGARRFTERPAPAEAVGALVVPGPAGWLPFSRTHAAAEWRALRLAIKRAALGDNLARVVAALDRPPPDVVLVGGVAGDGEILRVLDRVLPGAGIGRADVGGADVGGADVAGGRGRLGHRWAVAYGLTLLARDAR